MKKILLKTAEKIIDATERLLRQKDHYENVTVCLEDTTIGDSLLSIPYLNGIEKEKLTVICGKNLPMFKYFLPHVKSVQIEPEPYLRNIFYRVKKLKEAFSCANGAKKLIVTSPHRTNRIVKLARAIHAQEKIIYEGQKIVAGNRDFGLNRGFRVIKNPYKHCEARLDTHTERHLSRIFSEGFNREASMKRGDYINFYSRFRKGDGGYLVLVTDAAAPYRRFPQQKWQTFLDAMPRSLEIRVVGRTPMELHHPGLVNLIRKTDLLGAVKTVQNAHAVVGNETGLTHLGYLTGINTVCILGAGHLGGISPLGRV